MTNLLPVVKQRVFAQTPSVLNGLEQWVRRSQNGGSRRRWFCDSRRLRSVIWKQWKRGSVRFTELRKRGVAPCQQQGPRNGTPQCLLRLARGSEIECGPIAQPAEPPYTDPYVRWCDRESGRPPTYVDFPRRRTSRSTLMAPGPAADRYR